MLSCQLDSLTRLLVQQIQWFAQVIKIRAAHSLSKGGDAADLLRLHLHEAAAHARNGRGVAHAGPLRLFLHNLAAGMIAQLFKACQVVNGLLLGWCKLDELPLASIVILADDTAAALTLLIVLLGGS